MLQDQLHEDIWDGYLVAATGILIDVGIERFLEVRNVSDGSTWLRSPSEVFVFGLVRPNMQCAVRFLNLAYCCHVISFCICCDVVVHAVDFQMQWSK